MTRATLELEKQLTLALEETPSDTTESTFDFYPKKVTA